MNRDKALSRIDKYFQTGNFESDLKRRIAFKTESNFHFVNKDDLNLFSNDRWAKFLHMEDSLKYFQMEENLIISDGRKNENKRT